jgi:8-oxo-dGTP pyrophosphatase MutT (NUDIX family)
LALGTPEAFPAAPARKPARVLSVALGWIERRGRILLERRREDGPLRGTWDLPSALPRPGEAPGEALARELKARHSLRLARGTVTARVKHAILDTRLEIAIVNAPVATVSRRAALRWITISALADTATSSATIKAARAVAAQNRSQDSRDAASSSSTTGRAKA